MRKAAQEFLKTDLRLAGIAADTESAAVRVLSLPAAGTADPFWHALLDELAPGTHPEHEEADERYEGQGKKPLAPVSTDNIEDVLDHVSSAAEDISRHSAAAAGMVLDHLAQVLDPEEREALSASFDDPEAEPEPAPRPVSRDPIRNANLPIRRPDPEPAFDIRNQVMPPAVITMPQEPAPAQRPAARAPATTKLAPASAASIPPEALPQKPVGVTLRAFDVLDSQDESRLSQWAAVERSVRDLVPGSILLDARPPMSWATESCIAIDPEGNLHIWTLYKDGASWFALREWASEHRNLLALTRRDLVISKDSPINVHIVLPLDAVPDKGDANPEKPADIINTIMRTPAKHIHLYRLRVLTWNARRGLLVVPIA
jgi:hypothetical protein